ncbi:hypothetical protein Lalb_Chr01g0008811 [Lupinus albus]|uniref:Uncharacterized protein n=1 Tax=Lupinus albus TaxID=3870 RepID=A0A6A4R2E9_LUPAL|nr:hypothetical protein Lalb_Chr01g0008811 [Lupinus albus]
MKGQNWVLVLLMLVLWGCGKSGVTIVAVSFVLGHLAIKGLTHPTDTDTKEVNQRKGVRKSV